MTFFPVVPIRKRIAKSSESFKFSAPFAMSLSRGLSDFGKSFIFMNLFVNHLIVALITANPDVILTAINIDRFAFALNQLFVGIPKDLISAMSAFVVGFVVIFVGDFLWHKVIFDLSQVAIPKVA